MPDDISHSAFTYYNPQSASKTPHIDRLMANSVRLTDFHVSPTCSPTRAALLTGRYNDVTGVWHTIYGRSQLRADEITIADVFKHNGYATGMFFKWHLGDNYPFRPKDRGFEHVVWTKGGGVGQAPDYWGNMNDQATFWVNDRLVKMTDEDDGIEGAFSTTFAFNRAMDFMTDNLKKNRPFFVYLPTATAHSPFHMPPDARPGLNAKNATVENIDKNMGRLAKFLDDKGLAENTILIFMTDNGSGEFSYRGGKASFYDGGTRVPAFIRWPAAGLGGEGKGRDFTPLAAHIDVLPSLMDMLGLKDVPNRPEKLRLHGQSFKKMLDADPSNDPAAYRNREVTIVNMRTEDFEKYRQLSVKKDVWAGDKIIRKWRLTRKDAKSDWQLHDVLTDEKQANNLIGDPAHATVVAGLKEAYEKWHGLVAERAGEYTRIVLGHPAEPETQLSSHDFHSIELWNHQHIAVGKTGSGFIAVEFAKPGTYQFDLRRWPKEIADQSSLTTAPPGKVFDGKTTPKPLAIASARIRIWNGEKVYADEKKAAEPDADGVPFTLTNLPAGPAFIQTWFYDSAGEMLGAVNNNYVRLK